MISIKKFKTQAKFVLFLALILILHNEFIIYILSSIDWPPFMQCGSRNKNCLKVLFVADPQIIGEVHEEKWIAPVTRWDSDRFIEKNFQLAVEKFKPEVVIFLGDIMDEGSIATDEEFSRYLNRLKLIFVDDYKLQKIWIPGDNDIGGEGFERVSTSKLQRFHINFGIENPISLNGINFIKVNRLIHEKLEGKWTEKLSNHTNIIISHIPLLHIPGTYSKRIVTQINPSMIFSAHEHKSVSIKMNKFFNGQKTVTPITKNDKKVKRYRIGSDVIHEFIVPTCSYRMGVEHSGFGAAVINGYGSYLDYAVLWFPSRFQVLQYYSYFIYLVIIWILINLSYHCCGRLRRIKLKNRILYH